MTDCKHSEFVKKRLLVRVCSECSVDSIALENVKLRAKLDAANKEIERLKVWSSDSHVTQLESKLDYAVEALRSLTYRPLDPKCMYCATHVVRGHSADCIPGQALAKLNRIIPEQDVTAKAVTDTSATLMEAAEESCSRYSAAMNWKSAPGKEEAYKDGFEDGVCWQRRRSEKGDAHE